MWQKFKTVEKTKTTPLKQWSTHNKFQHEMHKETTWRRVSQGSCMCLFNNLHLGPQGVVKVKGHNCTCCSQAPVRPKEAQQLWNLEETNIRFTLLVTGPDALVTSY